MLPLLWLLLGAARAAAPAPHPGSGPPAAPSADLAAPAGPVVLRDDLQRAVRIARAPLRVVSLLPSITESVCALGECGRLVAVDRYSNWPPAVGVLPKVGGLDDAEVEAIVAARPDIVLLGASARVTGRLEQLGLVTFAVEVNSFAGIGRSLVLLGQVLGLPAQRAAALNAGIEAGVAALTEQARARRPAATPPPAVYFEVGAEPYAAGPPSFIGELLARLHTRNIVGAELGAFPKLNPEYVVRQDPAVIFVSARDAPRLAERPGWQTIRAVREQRLCSFAADERDAIVRPGPRVVVGMRAMADCLGRVAP